MDTSAIPNIVDVQRKFFRAGGTRELRVRQEALRRLSENITRREADLFEALRRDLGKSNEEAFTTEVGFVQAELRETIAEMTSWAKPERVGTPLSLWPGKSRIVREPYGTVLVVAPWNYPLQLSLSPLLGAVAAGNCVVLKPSELAPHTSKAVASLVAASFPAEHVVAVEGDASAASALLAERFDYYFFTGGERVGRLVYEAAARHLAPVTLELGGKSPCIVDRAVDVKTAARRIAWGKFLNAGQTCVAPDYVFADRTIAPDLLREIEASVRQFFGADPKLSPDYGRIITTNHFKRLKGYLEQGSLVFGGANDEAARYIAPTVMKPQSHDAAVMREEIFGPILPVIEYDRLDEALQFVSDRPRPLALYLFSENEVAVKRVETELSFGGGCINDTVVHLANRELPFGGVGLSGIGAYHGRASFELFSHKKSILEKSFFFDVPLRYPPYKGRLPWFRRLLR